MDAGDDAKEAASGAQGWNADVQEINTLGSATSRVLEPASSVGTWSCVSEQSPRGPA